MNNVRTAKKDEDKSILITNNDNALAVVFEFC